MPFNIGAGEMLIIIVVALIVFGPAKLPEMGAKFGKAMREFRRASSELTEELTREVEVKKEQEKPSAADASTTGTETAAPYVPAQTQAYSQDPAVASSEPLLGDPQDGAEPVAQASAQLPRES